MSISHYYGVLSPVTSLLLRSRKKSVRIGRFSSVIMLAVLGQRRVVRLGRPARAAVGDWWPVVGRPCRARRRLAAGPACGHAAVGRPARRWRRRSARPTGMHQGVPARSSSLAGLPGTATGCRPCQTGPRPLSGRGRRCGWCAVLSRPSLTGGTTGSSCTAR